MHVVAKNAGTGILSAPIVLVSCLAHDKGALVMMEM